MADVSFIYTETNPGFLDDSGGGIRVKTLIDQEPEDTEGYGGGRRAPSLTELGEYSVDFGGGREALIREEIHPLLSLPLPEVATGPAIDIQLESVTLSGYLEDDGGLNCDCAFEWGLNDGYGFVTPFRENSGGEFFAEMLTGLLPDTTYHFRAVSWNAFGVGYGIDRIFRTARQVENAYFQRSMFFLLTEDE
ncbi:MAG: hypothetical protein JW712_09250 [Dehalococcoidales bacterium]|nr:hypothetical protein [Dehalococcoidales bacterium]